MTSSGGFAVRAILACATHSSPWLTERAVIRIAISRMSPGSVPPNRRYSPRSPTFSASAVAFARGCTFTVNRALVFVLST